MNRKREKARDTHSISKWKEELQDHEARQCQQFGKRELESTHSTTSSSKSGCETDTVRDQTMSSAKRRRILHTLGDGDATNTGVMNVEEKYDMTTNPTENQEKEIGGEQKGRSIFDAFTHVHNGSETDSQRSMTLKAQHEVTSLSPVTRNRILESMHGVLSDEEDHHEDRGYRQPPGRANKSEEQRSRREARRNTEFGQEKHSRMELLSTEIKILKTATGRRVDSSRDVVEGIQIDYEIGQARGEGRYATSAKEQEFPQQRQQQNLRERGSFIREKLDELDDAISDIDQKVAYDEAIQVDDGYVKDRKFRLVFLRADSFDVRKAAQRLVAFMDEKLRRFGPHALTRQLTIDDLSAVAKSMVIKKGAVQLLPTRDTSGRAILVAYYHVSQVRDELRKDPKSLGDAIFYLMSSMAEDEETQRRGLVTIGIIVSSPLPKKEDVDVFLHSSLKDLGKNLYRWCPLKCNAHHHWIQDNPTVVTHDETKRSNKADYATSKISQSQEDDIASDVSESSSMSGVTIFETIIGCMGKEYRLRTRLHKGSYGEFKEILKTFGIPVDHLPFSIDGSEIRVSGSHTKWIQKRRQKEAALILRRVPERKQTLGKVAPVPIFPISDKQEKEEENENSEITNASCFDVIDIPGRHDVCLGRGTTLHQHTGNVAMRAMMEPLVDEYENATSSRRQELNKVIIQAVELIGGRFLTNKSTDGGWFEVVIDMSIVEKSVGGIFRSMVSRVNATRNRS